MFSCHVWLHLYCTSKAKLKDQIMNLSEFKSQTAGPWAGCSAFTWLLLLPTLRLEVNSVFYLNSLSCKNWKLRLTEGIYGNCMDALAEKYLSKLVATTATWFDILKIKYYNF